MNFYWGSVPLVIAGILGGLTGPKGTEWSPVIHIILCGVAGVVASAVLVFIWYLIVAPSRIHADQEKRIVELEWKHAREITEIRDDYEGKIEEMTSEMQTTTETLKSLQGSEDVPLANMPAWDAVVHILNRSEDGRGKKEKEVVELLRQTVRHKKVIMWGRPEYTITSPHEIDPDFLANHELILQPDNHGCVIADTQTVSDALRRDRKKIHFRYLQFWEKQILAKWPARASQEEINQERSTLIVSWRGMLDDAKRYLSSDPGMKVSALEQFIDDHAAGKVFYQYFSMHDVSSLLIGSREYQKFEGSDAEVFIMELNEMINVIESQWFPQKKHV